MSLLNSIVCTKFGVISSISFLCHRRNLPTIGDHSSFADHSSFKSLQKVSDLVFPFKVTFVAHEIDQILNGEVKIVFIFDAIEVVEEVARDQAGAG